MTRGCQVCTRGRIEKAPAAGMNDNLLNAVFREAFRMADGSSAEASALCAPEVSAGR